MGKPDLVLEMLQELKEALARFPEYQAAVDAIESLNSNPNMTIDEKKGAFFGLTKLLEDYSFNVDFKLTEPKPRPDSWKLEGSKTALLMRVAELREERVRRAMMRMVEEEETRNDSRNKADTGVDLDRSAGKEV